MIENDLSNIVDRMSANPILGNEIQHIIFIYCWIFKSKKDRTNAFDEKNIDAMIDIAINNSKNGISNDKNAMAVI